MTIDGDPGGYPGAKPRISPRFFRTIAEPSTGWARIRRRKKSFRGFGPAGASRNCGGSRSRQTAPNSSALKQQMQDPWELLPARGLGPQGSIFSSAHKARPPGGSTLFFYDAIEREPSPPGAKLQFDAIRHAMKEESPFCPARGDCRNVETPLMVLPNVYSSPAAPRIPATRTSRTRRYSPIWQNYWERRRCSWFLPCRV